MPFELVSDFGLRRNRKNNGKMLIMPHTGGNHPAIEMKPDRCRQSYNCARTFFGEMPKRRLKAVAKLDALP